MEKPTLSKQLKKKYDSGFLILDSNLIGPMLVISGYKKTTTVGLRPETLGKSYKESPNFGQRLFRHLQCNIKLDLNVLRQSNVKPKLNIV